MRLADREIRSQPEGPGSPNGSPARREPAGRGSPRSGLGTRWGWGALVALGYILATVVMTWPYAPRMASHVPPGEDPLLQVWIARWVQHALVTDPLHLYDANAFHPFRHTLAYSDSNVPAALLAAPVFLLTGNAVLANNLLVLGTFVLAAGGVYALVGHFTGNRAAGFLAGLAYAFLPYRFSHIWHLNQLSHAWTPWVLLALVALIERRTWRAALTFGLLLAVQALASFYIAFQVAFALAVALPVAFVADRRARTPGFLLRLAAAGGLAALLIVPLALPYLQVRNEQGFERTIREAESQTWSATPESYLKVEHNNRVWRWLTEEHSGEDALFPGGIAALGALAGAALGWRRGRRPLTAALLLIAALAFVVSLGPTWRAAEGGTTPLPYRFLFNHFPFFKAMRVPSRFGILTNFAIATLAGLGAAWVWAWLAPRVAPERRRLVGGALTALLALAILGELYSVPLPLQRVDLSPAAAAPYEWLARQPDDGAVMEFPAEVASRATSLAMYWSTLHWKPLVQGYSGFAPRSYGDSIKWFTGDLKRPNGTVARRVSQVNGQNIGVLQDLGVRYLVFHRHGYKREDWPVLIAQLEGTGAVDRAAEFDEVVIYHVREREVPAREVDLALFAPSLAVPGRFWEPTLVVRNQSDALALLNVKRPLKMTTTWRDERGRQVRRDTLTVNLPAIVPPGDLLCSVRVCPAASGFSLPPTMDEMSVRLFPTDPGRYTVRIDVTGEVTASRTLQVEVVRDPPVAEEEGPPIAFLGATPAAPELAPGDTAALTLDWEARRQPPEDYTLFAQLIGPDGQVWGQYDAPAGWTSHYTSVWVPGERVSLPWIVPLKADAPPGQYRLLVGLYRHTKAGVERVPVRYPDGDATEHWAAEYTMP